MGGRRKRKKRLEMKRRQREKRLKIRFPKPEAVKSFEHASEPKAPKTSVDAGERYIKFGEIKPVPGPVPSDPSDDQIPPYLRRHCSGADSKGMSIGYCNNSCIINDFCEGELPGNLEIKKKFLREAFELIQRKEEIGEREKYLLKGEKPGGMPVEFKTTSLKRAWRAYYQTFITETRVPEESIKIYIDGQEITRQRFKELCETLYAA